MTEPARISHDEIMAKIPEPYRSWKHDGVEIVHELRKPQSALVAEAA